MAGDLFQDDHREFDQSDPLPLHSQAHRPLADRLRPTQFSDFVGQHKIAGSDASLRKLIESDKVPSMVFWGPPGTGKTTLAHIVARTTHSAFIQLSAVDSGIKDIRQAVEMARLHRSSGRRTILFIDEIHRYNKSQQDALLPHVESGIFVLIGATTENPSFTVNSALTSRCRVFILESLEDSDLRKVLARGLHEVNDLRGEARLELSEKAIQAVIQFSDGDARRALGLLEVIADGTDQKSPAIVEEGQVLELAQRQLLYDCQGEEHYNLISALHKTMRSSDPHAAAYWCQRMLAAGEDPLYLLRRLTRMASEDVGLANPNAIAQANACFQAFQNIGRPEGDIFIVQLAVYLAVSPKSNALYRASKETAEAVQKGGTLPVPLHLRNAPTNLMKEIGYGKGYSYDHDSDGNFEPKQGLPDKLDGSVFYRPSEQGYEKQVRERLDHWDKARTEEREARGSKAPAE